MLCKKIPRCVIIYKFFLSITFFLLWISGSDTDTGKYYQKLAFIERIEKFHFEITGQFSLGTYFFNIPFTYNQVTHPVFIAKESYNGNIDFSVKTINNAYFYQRLSTGFSIIPQEKHAPVIASKGTLFEYDFFGYTAQAAYLFHLRKYSIMHSILSAWHFKYFYLDFGPTVFYFHRMQQETRFVYGTSATEEISSIKIGPLIKAGVNFSFGMSRLIFGAELKFANIIAYPENTVNVRQYSLISDFEYHQQYFSFGINTGINL